MELYVLAGGQTDSLKRWEADLNAQFFPTYTNGKPTVLGKNEKGQDIIEHRRLLVAPIQLYKICFAKEEIDNVLAMVCPTDYINKRYSVLDKLLKWFRRIIGLKEAPIPTKLNPFLQPNQVDKAVFVLPIGLKEDQIHDGKEFI